MQPRRRHILIAGCGYVGQRLALRLQDFSNGIAALAKRGHVGDVGAAIDDYVSSVPGKPLGILEDYVGHGIGSEMHMAPDVLNYRTSHRGRAIQSIS